MKWFGVALVYLLLFVNYQLAHPRRSSGGGRSSGRSRGGSWSHSSHSSSSWSRSASNPSTSHASSASHTPITGHSHSAAEPANAHSQSGSSHGYLPSGGLSSHDNPSSYQHGGNHDYSASGSSSSGVHNNPSDKMQIKGHRHYTPINAAIDEFFASRYPSRAINIKPVDSVQPSIHSNVHEYLPSSGGLSDTATHTYPSSGHKHYTPINAAIDEFFASWYPSRAIAIKPVDSVQPSIHSNVHEYLSSSGGLLDAATLTYPSSEILSGGNHNHPPPSPSSSLYGVTRDYFASGSSSSEIHRNPSDIVQIKRQKHYSPINAAIDEFFASRYPSRATNIKPVASVQPIHSNLSGTDILEVIPGGAHSYSLSGGLTGSSHGYPANGELSGGTRHSSPGIISTNVEPIASAQPSGHSNIGYSVSSGLSGTEVSPQITSSNVKPVHGQQPAYNPSYGHVPPPPYTPYATGSGLSAAGNSHITKANIKPNYNSQTAYPANYDPSSYNSLPPPYTPYHVSPPAYTLEGAGSYPPPYTSSGSPSYSPTYISHTTSSGSNVNNILAGLAKWNSARSFRNSHTHYYHHYNGNDRYSPSSSTNSLSSSQSPPPGSPVTELYNCTLTLANDGGANVISIPCDIVTSFASDTEMNNTLPVPSTFKPDTNETCTILVIRNKKSEETKIPCDFLTKVAFNASQPAPGQLNCTEVPDRENKGHSPCEMIPSEFDEESFKVIPLSISIVAPTVFDQTTNNIETTTENSDNKTSSIGSLIEEPTTTHLTTVSEFTEGITSLNVATVKS